MGCPKHDCMYHDINGYISEEDRKERELAMRSLFHGIIADCGNEGQMTLLGQCVSYHPLKENKSD